MLLLFNFLRKNDSCGSIGEIDNDNFKVKINVDQEKLEKVAIKRCKSKLDLQNAITVSARRKLSSNVNQAYEFELEDKENDLELQQQKRLSQYSSKNGAIFFIDDNI